MTDHPSELLLNNYADGTLAPAERRAVSEHLRGCSTCRSDVARLQALLAAAAALPRRIEPRRDLWTGIETRIVARPRLGVWLLAAAAVLALAIGLRVVLTARGSSWEVVRIAGAPTIGGRRVSGVAAIRGGEWLETDDSSRARIRVGEIGQVEIQTATRIRLVDARVHDHRLALAHGAIEATVSAPPRVFFVETAAGVAVDLGCAYRLEEDSLGNGRIHVTGGIVEFQWRGMRSIVPLGASAETRAGFGPGTPYVDDAPPALRSALVRFDFERGGAALQEVLGAARPEDGLSLWHLLLRVDGSLRPAVYDRLAAFVPPPEGVTRQGILGLDQAMLDRYWDFIPRTVWRRGR